MDDNVVGRGDNVVGEAGGERDHSEPPPSSAKGDKLLSAAAAAAVGDVHKGWTGLRLRTPGAADPPATWRDGKTISGKDGSR